MNKEISSGCMKIRVPVYELDKNGDKIFLYEERRRLEDLGENTINNYYKKLLKNTASLLKNTNENIIELIGIIEYLEYANQGENIKEIAKSRTKAPNQGELK